MKRMLLALIITMATIALVVGCESEYRVTLEVMPQEGGEISGEGEYSSETEVTVEARPEEGYSFVEWVEEGETVSTEEKYEFVIENDRDLMAFFEEEGQETIKIFDEEDRLIFEYAHEEFLDWAENHWKNIFDEIPAFHEDYPVFPEDLSYFDDTEALSPCGNMVAFSLHDFHAAAHMSFVGVVNLQTGKVDLVDQENRGQIDEFYWSPGSDYLAYPLNTTEVEGYLLSNDNVEQMSKEFTLDEEDIRKALNRGEYSSFLPFFRDLSWWEDEKRLMFSTNSPECKEARMIIWGVDPAGEDLVIEDMVPGETTLLEMILKFFRNLFLC